MYLMYQGDVSESFLWGSRREQMRMPPGTSTTYSLKLEVRCTPNPLIEVCKYVLDVHQGAVELGDQRFIRIKGEISYPPGPHAVQ